MTDDSMTTTTRRAARRLLDAVHLPVALYLGFIGATSLAGDVSPAMAELPGWLVTAWALSLVLGAALVTWGVMGERSRAESVGHMFHLYGIGFYAVVHLSLIGGTDVVTLAVLASVAAMRMRLLARSRAARREAGRILRGQ